MFVVGAEKPDGFHWKSVLSAAMCAGWALFLGMQLLLCMYLTMPQLAMLPLSLGCFLRFCLGVVAGLRKLLICVIHNLFCPGVSSCHLAAVGQRGVSASGVHLRMYTARASLLFAEFARWLHNPCCLCCTRRWQVLLCSLGQ